VDEQIQANAQGEEDHKASMLHLETVNMMTKYQIVYSKLETSVINLIKSTEMQKKQKLSRAFSLLLTNANI